MTDPNSLATAEGVDEGSAASTAESPAPEDRDGVLGEPPHGAPADDAQAAGPADMETSESRKAREELGPGQQLAEGEG